MVRLRLLPRLFLAFAVLLMLAITIVWFLCAQWLEQDTREEIRHSIEVRARTVAEWVRPWLDRPVEEQERRQLKELGVELGTRWTLVRSDGTVVADSHEEAGLMALHSDRPEIQAALRDGVGSDVRRSATLGVEMMYVAVRLGDPPGPGGVVRASFHLGDVDERLGRLSDLMLVAAVVAAVVALAFAYGLARWITAPVVRMTRTAESLAAGGAITLAETQRTDEIGDLERSLRQMRQDLADRMEDIGAERNKVAAVLSSMIEGVVAVDDQETVLLMNTAAGSMLGLEPDRVHGRPLYEFLRNHKVSEALRTVLESGRPVRDEMAFLDGTRRVLELQAAPLRGAGPRPGGAVLVLHDVSELRHLETVRQDFIANASHELKTPLTAVQGLAETLVGDPDMPTATRQDFLRRLKVQARRLGDLVSDLLVLSRLESREAPFVAESLDLCQVARQCFAKACEGASGLEMKAEIPDQPLLVQADQSAVEQVLVNLLHNAVRYTPDGGRVTLRLGAADAGGHVVEVIDTGIGLRPEDQERIFERFYRVDKARARDQGGTGLGLSIVRHAVERNGGRVSVESRLGSGSTFRVWLPAGRETEVKS